MSKFAVKKEQYNYREGARLSKIGRKFGRFSDELFKLRLLYKFYYRFVICKGQRVASKLYKVNAITLGFRCKYNAFKPLD